MSRIDKLVTERDALRREWQSNHAARIKIQHRLDSLTTEIARLTGVPMFLGDLVPPALDMFAGLGGRRHPRKRI